METARTTTLKEWRDATRGALSEYLVEELVDKILGDIDTRANAYQPKRAGGNVYRQALAEPERGYPDESPAAQQGDPRCWAVKLSVQALDTEAALEIIRQGGWIKVFSDSGRIWAYAAGGELVGPVARGAFQLLVGGGEIRADNRASGSPAVTWIEA